MPRYQSTTSINAIHDIQNEMTPEDVYVPMAARIKMFERGLGNASNKVTPPCSIVSCAFLFNSICWHIDLITRIICIVST